MYKPKQKSTESHIVIQGPNQWVQRQKSIDSDVKNYMEFWGKSAMGTEASAHPEESWKLELIRYVREVATTQAQMIHQSKVGYDAGIVFGYANRKTGHEINLWLDEQRRQCASGVIDVHVPNERLNAWKRSCAYWKAHNTNSGNLPRASRYA